MKKRLFFLLLTSLSMATSAKVVLPPFLSDNMVLQQQTNAAVWGTAEPGKKVIIRPSWTKQKTVVVADTETGKWSARIATPAAGGPYEIDFSDGEKLTLKNVLIGEVWFCSGQSNMEMPVKGYGSQPAKGSTEAIATAHPSTPIRICTIDKLTNKKPQEAATTPGWQTHEPQAVADASATAYFFGKTLYDALEIPIGLLIADWGGSTIETWMEENLLRSEFPEINLDHLTSDQAPRNGFQPGSLLYNGMVNPLVPFTFKGIIWYQGEANRGTPDLYIRLQAAYVKMMREKFQVPDAPFYFVQIAPYPYGDPTSWVSGYFCEAQEKSVSVIPHSGMATTLDVGAQGVIHPCDKKPVGQRLAWLALQNDYNLKGIEATAPSYKDFKVDGNKILVNFNVGPLGLSPLGVPVEGFEIAGSDKIFHPAKATLRGGKTVEVYSEEVPEPAAVRYGFRNWGVGTIFNNFGIPAGPFRTDDWQL